MLVHTRTVIDIETGRILADEAYEYSGPIAKADRSAQAQAAQAGKTATSTGAGYGDQAANISGTLLPTLKTEAQGNSGFTPQQKANMLTAGEQGAGGATGSLNAQGALTAARTRNSGALSTLQDQNAFSKAKALSGNALNVENQSADLAQQNKQRALGQLGGLYGTDVGAQLHSMGLVPEDVNAGVNAGKSGWFQNLEGGLNTAANLGKAAAAF